MLWNCRPVEKSQVSIIWEKFSKAGEVEEREGFIFIVGIGKTFCFRADPPSPKVPKLFREVYRETIVKYFMQTINWYLGTIQVYWSFAQMTIGNNDHFAMAK